MMAGAVTTRIVPCTVKAAIKWVAQTHRHLPKVQGGLFAVGVEDRGVFVGAGIAGNPAQVWQGTGRFAITRVATMSTPYVDGTPSTCIGGPEWGGHTAPYCTMIYGALCRAGKALGYLEAWTYTLPHEPGNSLRGAGFIDMGMTSGGEHDRPSRSRSPAVCPLPKRRWVRFLSDRAPTLIAMNENGRRAA